MPVGPRGVNYSLFPAITIGAGKGKMDIVYGKAKRDAEILISRADLKGAVGSLTPETIIGVVQAGMLFLMGKDKVRAKGSFQRASQDFTQWTLNTRNKVDSSTPGDGAGPRADPKVVPTSDPLAAQDDPNLASVLHTQLIAALTAYMAEGESEGRKKAIAAAELIEPLLPRAEKALGRSRLKHDDIEHVKLLLTAISLCFHAGKFSRCRLIGKTLSSIQEGDRLAGRLANELAENRSFLMYPLYLALADKKKGIFLLHLASFIKKLARKEKKVAHHRGYPLPEMELTVVWDMALGILSYMEVPDGLDLFVPKELIHKGWWNRPVEKPDQEKKQPKVKKGPGWDGRDKESGGDDDVKSGGSKEGDAVDVADVAAGGEKEAKKDACPGPDGDEPASPESSSE